MSRRDERMCEALVENAISSTVMGMVTRTTTGDGTTMGDEDDDGR
jgi:hypothetical protein